MVYICCVIMGEYGMGFNKKILSINSDSIVMTSGEEVMMSWEDPLMKKHADICSSNGGFILEVGFGMGISANYIQSNNITKHIIVESHPQILDILYKWSNDKPNVTIIEGDWFDNIDKICQYSFDGIFFDTHQDLNRLLFKKLVVDKCLKSGGVFTWFEPSGANTYNCEYKLESVEVNPINCSYYSHKVAMCPYLIS